MLWALLKLAQPVTDTTSVSNVTRPISVRPASGDVAERYQLRVAVGVLADEKQCTGSVEDISVTGARIEGVEEPPPEGSHVHLGLSFYAHALPVPIRGTVVRHTEGGFAVRFEDVDFRTQILLRTLLPNVGTDAASEVTHAHVSPAGYVEAQLAPAMLEACAKVAESKGMSLEDWVVEALERAAYDSLND